MPNSGIAGSYGSFMGFPARSAGKESTCSAGDLGSIPGSGRPPAPWIKDRLATPVFMGIPGGSDNNKPAYNVGDMLRSLGWQDPLEEGMTTHLGIFAWRIPMVRVAWWATVHGVAKTRTRLND